MFDDILHARPRMEFTVTLTREQHEQYRALREFLRKHSAVPAPATVEVAAR
ncbi:MAG: hypothetical protein JRG76_08035 [Deltaproteobacteria bacterium]|nr:hypothetical protein [Deltaproteobacteria bacterium]MBW2414443.1 hypothetical protein [Deltaproteobacteria bacterium]